MSRSLVLVVCLVVSSFVAATDRLSTRSYPISVPGDNGNSVVNVKQYTFPGKIRAQWWISDQDAVILANGHLFMSTNFGSTGEWISLTEDIPELQLNSSRTGQGIVANIRYRSVPNGTAQEMILVETATGITYILSLEPVLLVAAVTLESAPVTSASHAKSSSHGLVAGGSLVFSEIMFHPTDPDTAFGIVTDPNCRSMSMFMCNSYLFMVSSKISPDMPFQLWRYVPLSFNVMQAFFGSPDQPSADASTPAFVVATPTEKGRMMDGVLYRLSTSDIESAAASIHVSPVLNSVFGEETIGKFSIVAAADSQSRIGLYITDDNFDHLTHANFGTHVFPSDTHPDEEELDEREAGYALVDVSDEVFINVYRGSVFQQQRWGHTYSSGKSGKKFSLSLPYNRRLDRQGSAVDFHRVAGIDGAIIANIVLNPSDDSCRSCTSANSCDESCTFGTVFSRDNGKSWQKISFGESSDDESTLNFHSYSSAYVFNSHPIISSKSSPGLIIATGNEGAFLDLREDNLADANVYISRDSGETWNLLSRGRALYGEVNYGGFLYLLPSGRKSRIVNVSLDAGATWIATPIADAPVEYVFSSVLVPPSKSDSKYISTIVFPADNKGGDSVIWIDFSSIQARTCVDMDAPNEPQSDFEFFQPSGYFSEKGDGFHCMMGRLVSYIRKRSGSLCWIDAPPTDANGPSPLALPRQVVLCNCTKADYECDVNYREEGENCVLEVFGEDTPIAAVQNNNTGNIAVKRIPTLSECVTGETVTLQTGYRKLGGDYCVGGLNLEPSTVPCPAPSANHAAGYISLVALAFGGVLLFVIQRAKASSSFAEMVSRAFPPLRYLLRGKVRSAAESEHHYVTLEHNVIEDDDDDEEDIADEETALKTSRREAMAPHPREPETAAIETTTQEHRETVNNDFSVPISVEVDGNEFVITSESDPFFGSSIPVPSKPAAATFSVTENGNTRLLELTSMEPPPLPADVPASPPKAATGNLDFLDFGQ